MPIFDLKHSVMGPGQITRGDGTPLAVGVCDGLDAAMGNGLGVEESVGIELGARPGRVHAASRTTLTVIALMQNAAFPTAGTLRGGDNEVKAAGAKGTQAALRFRSRSSVLSPACSLAT